MDPPEQQAHVTRVDHKFVEFFYERGIGRSVGFRRTMSPRQTMKLDDWQSFFKEQAK